MENYKIIIKPIKPKVKETDPAKIEAMKEKRRLQREARKDKPKEPKEPKESKIKPDNSHEINEINKKIKNLIGFTVDEINDKLKGVPPPQPIKNELKKIKCK
jgi:ribosomal protein L13E